MVGYPDDFRNDAREATTVARLAVAVGATLVLVGFAVPLYGATPRTEVRVFTAPHVSIVVRILITALIAVIFCATIIYGRYAPALAFVDTLVFGIVLASLATLALVALTLAEAAAAAQSYEDFLVTHGMAREFTGGPRPGLWFVVTGLTCMLVGAMVWRIVIERFRYAPSIPSARPAR